MELKKLILNKIPLFLKEKYSDTFFLMLKNLKEIEKEDKKKKKINLFDLPENNFKKLKKIHIYKYFKEIENSILTQEIYNEKIFSHLEISYLKNKAKFFHRKLNLVGIVSKKKTEYCVDFYIKLCKYYILKLNQKRNQLKTPNLNNKYKRTSNLRDTFRLFKSEEKKKKKEKNIDDDFRFDDEEEDNNKIINLFIGSFDINKLMHKETKIQLEKEGFVNAFIFKNIHDQDNSENNKLFQFQTPSKKKYSNVISLVKSYRENSLKKKHLNMTSVSKITNEESTENLIPKNLIKKKQKKRLILTKINNYNNNSIINNSNTLFKNRIKLNKKKTTDFNLSDSDSKTYKKILSYDYKTSKIQNLPKIDFSNLRINHSNLKNKNHLKTFNFLSRKDLYY